MWTEQPLITYKKQEVNEDLEIYVDYLHQVFRELDQVAQDKLMAMYGPEEGREGLKWKLYRWICLEIAFPSDCVIISLKNVPLESAQQTRLEVRTMRTLFTSSTAV